MKKYVSTMLVILLLTVTIFSCKKSNGPKDYNASIKDKTWWGEFAYTGQDAEYYSVHFNVDNSLTWTQWSGDYPGQWTLNGKQLTITFTGNSVEINADISDDDKLMNISDNTANSEINSGQLIVNPKISLDNTVWKVSDFSQAVPLGPDYQMSFLPGSIVRFKFPSFDYRQEQYARSASGAVIRTTTVGVIGHFGIIVSDKEMNGNIPGSNARWQAVKQ